MQRIARYTLVFATGVMLCLPPGTCFVAAAAGKRAPQPVKHSCCRHQAPCDDGSSKRPVDESPSLPKSRCCCVYESTQPPVGETLVKAPDLIAWGLVLTEESFVSQADVEALASLYDTGPPLRVLLCVWRC